jgi:hypothetical protein
MKYFFGVLDPFCLHLEQGMDHRGEQLAGDHLGGLLDLLGELAGRQTRNQGETLAHPFANLFGGEPFDQFGETRDLLQAADENQDRAAHAKRVENRGQVLAARVRDLGDLGAGIDGQW